MLSLGTTVQIKKQCAFIFPFRPTLYVKRILKLLEIHSGEFNFTFVDDAMILEINQQYLHHDYVTDIITFNLGTPEEISGDVYIAVMQAKRQAEELGHSFALELKTLIVHGILHLLGYEDYTEADRVAMHKRQDDLVRTAG